jgi:GWxTD domain-containing protein
MTSRYGLPVRILSWGSLFVLAAATAIAVAQQPPAASPKDDGSRVTTPAPAERKDDPLQGEVSERTKEKQSKRLQGESKTYKWWLEEDVVWIITDEERKAFLQLANDDERNNFIEQFWQRRNPKPHSPDNEYKEQHYLRIAYANERYGTDNPGWKTGRGRIYIMFGPPDEVDAHPGGAHERPPAEGGGSTSTYPFEVWRYRYLEGVGQKVEIEFVDTCRCGDYKLTIDRSEQNRFRSSSGLGASSGTTTLYPFPEQLEIHVGPFNLLPFYVRVDYINLTRATVLALVTVQVQNKDVTLVSKDGIQRGTVELFGRVTGITGRIAQTFEDTVQINSPAGLLQETIAQASVYGKVLPLVPGRYRLDLVLKDVNGDRVGTWRRGIAVPEFGEDRLAASTLIVADQMEKVASQPARRTGSFVIGGTKLRPRGAPANGIPATFKRSQNANVWVQVYNLSVDPQTHKPNATIEYDVVKLGTPGKPAAAPAPPAMHLVKTTGELGSTGRQVTLTESLPLAELEPGIYEIAIKVADKVSNQSLEPVPTARFVVE